MLFPSAGAAMGAGALAGGEEPTPTIVLVKGDRVQLAPGPSTPEFLFIFCLLYPLLQALTAFALPCALFFCFSCSGAPAIFCLKPGRIGTVVAVSKVRCDHFLVCHSECHRDKLRLVCAQDHGDATPFKVRAQDNGRSSWFGRQHLAHA